MRAGDLRHYVTFEQPARPTKQANGEPIRTWHEAFDDFVSIDSLSGRELERARTLIESVSHQVVMRYRGDFDKTYRIRYSDLECDRYLSINHIRKHDEKPQWLILLCTEDVGQK